MAEKFDIWQYLILPPEITPAVLKNAADMVNDRSIPGANGIIPLLEMMGHEIGLKPGLSLEIYKELRGVIWSGSVCQKIQIAWETAAIAAVEALTHIDQHEDLIDKLPDSKAVTEVVKSVYGRLARQRIMELLSPEAPKTQTTIRKALQLASWQCPDLLRRVVETWSEMAQTNDRYHFLRQIANDRCIGEYGDLFEKHFVECLKSVEELDLLSMESVLRGDGRNMWLKEPEISIRKSYLIRCHEAMTLFFRAKIRPHYRMEELRSCFREVPDTNQACLSLRADIAERMLEQADLGQLRPGYEFLCGQDLEKLKEAGFDLGPRIREKRLKLVREAQKVAKTSAALERLLPFYCDSPDDLRHCLSKAMQGIPNARGMETFINQHLRHQNHADLRDIAIQRQNTLFVAEVESSSSLSELKEVLTSFQGCHETPAGQKALRRIATLYYCIPEAPEKLVA